MHHRAKFTDHEIETMRQLREAGMSYGEIARKFDAAKSYVWRVVKFLDR